MIHPRALRVLPIAAVLAGVAGPADAGFFDLFMQGSQPSRPAIEQPVPSYYPPDPFSVPSFSVPRFSAPRVARPRHQVRIVRKTTPEKPETFAGKTATIMNDATLREGDAVMTEKGVRIFAGASSSKHRPRDFAALDETKGLSPAQQTALAEIDAQRTQAAPESVKQAPAATPLVTGRSAVSGTARAWKWVRDPKGVLVRYVGP